MTKTILKFTEHLPNNEWLTNFITIIFNNCSESEIAYVLANLIKYFENSKGEGYFKFDEQNSSKRFFNYLEAKLQEKGFPCIKAALDLTIANSNGYDFIHNFYHYFILTNIEDAKIHTTIPEESKSSFYASAQCRLGEYVIGSVEIIKFDNDIRFDDLKVKSNARRLGIATMIMDQVMALLTNLYPGSEIYATNVDKNNKDAIAFYRSLGCKFSNSHVNEYYTVTLTPEKMLEHTRNLKQKTNDV